MSPAFDASPMPGNLMAYLGLVPSEHSFGAGIRRGGMLVHFIASFAWAESRVYSAFSS